MVGVSPNQVVTPDTVSYQPMPYGKIIFTLFGLFNYCY